MEGKNLMQATGEDSIQEIDDLVQWLAAKYNIKPKKEDV